MNDTNDVEDIVLLRNFADLDEAEVATCLRIIEAGDAVSLESAARELPLVTHLAIALRNGAIVGVGTIKRIRENYAGTIADRSKKSFPAVTRELGYVAILASEQGRGLSKRIVEILLSQYNEPLFATTSNPRMKGTLARYGFVKAGVSWKNKYNKLLSLYLRLVI
jgi:hypothetical protein